MARDYKYWGGIGAAFLTTGLLGVATTWWGVVATSSLPWWPTIVFGLLSLVGVYFLLAGWRGWPVPAEKAERIRKRQDAERSRAGAKRQHEEVERREAAGKRARLSRIAGKRPRSTVWWTNSRRFAWNSIPH